MMGSKERAFGPLPPVTLEELVAPDHFYRHLERTLDLTFVRDLVRDAYAETGRPSIDPVVFFKLQLVMFFEGLRSERQLMHAAADRLSLRWYLGDDLTTSLPDHSSLSRIRQRYGLAVLRRFFEAIVGQCYVPLSQAGHRSGLFRDADFAYDAAADAYRCPAGKTLRFLTLCHTTRRRIYAAPAAACAACALRPRCTTAQRGRRIGRSLDAACLERVRGDHDTEVYARAMRKRKVWVEPLFAEAKDWHGLRRFRLRGLESVNGEARLIAAGQNVKRLLSRTGWGRRPSPSGAAGIALPAPSRAPTLAR